MHRYHNGNEVIITELGRLVKRKKKKMKKRKAPIKDAFLRIRYGIKTYGITQYQRGRNNIHFVLVCVKSF